MEMMWQKMEIVKKNIGNLVNKLKKKNKSSKKVKV